MSARRLKVLMVIDRAGTSGGAERFALGLAAHLPHDQFEPWVCSTWTAHPTGRAQLSEFGVPLVELGRQSRWQAYRFASLAPLLWRERFDILHTHKFGSNLWGTVIGRACRVPVIVAQEHSWSYHGNPLRIWLDRHVVSQLATRFVAVSRADASAMVRIEGVPAEKVVVLPSASYIPPPPSSRPVREELSLSEEVPVVATACVLRPEKAVTLLLEAFAAVLRDLPAAHLLIAGDGPCRAELEKQARQLRIDSGVHFLGYREDVVSVLRAADVAVLSSHREGTPLLVAECMAAGTPLVASAVGGIPDMVRDGETGVLVPPQDAAALQKALLRLLRDPAGRERLANRASGQLANYTIDAVAARYGKLYQQLAQTVGIS